MGGKAHSGKGVKSRFDGLDVAAMTSLVRRTLLGHKLANVYDGSQLLAAGGGGGSGTGGGAGGRATYILKLANPSAASAPHQQQEADPGRAMLLIESGVRFHPTSYASSTAGGGDGRSAPSPFASKLRKHLRGLRLENATQVGDVDRVVDFRFGAGGSAHHLVLELYAQGNLILTDAGYRILALLRTHEYEGSGDGDGGAGGQVSVRVGSVYPVTFATTLRASDGGDGSDAHAHADADEDAEHEDCGISAASGLLGFDGPSASAWARQEMEAWRAMVEKEEEQRRYQPPGKGKKQGKKRKGASISLKNLLFKPTSGVQSFGPSLLEHCILAADLKPSLEITPDNVGEVMSDAAWSALVGALKTEGTAVMDRLANDDGGGYVLYRPKAAEDGESSADGIPDTKPVGSIPHSDKVFEEFQPHLLRQHAERPSIRYPNFAAAVDEFFSLIEGQRRALRADQAEAAARDRLERIRQDQQSRLDALERQMERMRENAQLVEANAEDVDKALLVINSAMNSGMDWEALNALVEVEQRNENPIAMLVKELDLANENVVLALPDIVNHHGSDGEPIPCVNITLSLKESAFGNARVMFDMYRSSKEKSKKTTEASAKALQAAEATAQRQLEEVQKRRVMTVVAPQRKQHWFEKFVWFITSDNYLVVAGRDAQQNEQLVKRYLRPGDAYLHADVHGAASVILRAKRRRVTGRKTEVLPLSDQALREAGSFTICRSSAWASRMVTSAWWVDSYQVSKTAPTGEYLTVGSFMIRGKKNFLPPNQLEMGIGVLFRLGDDASIARHLNDRRDFALLEREKSEAAAREDDDIVDGKGVEDLTVDEAPVDAAPVDDGRFKGTPVEAEEKKDNTDLNDPSPQQEDQGSEHSSQDSENATDEEIPPEKEHTSAVNGNTLTDAGRNVGQGDAAGGTGRNVNQLKKKEKKLTRGKRAKMKRAAKKYAEQDDEDRELAMLALHGGERKSRKKGKGSRQVRDETSMQLKAATETAELLMRDASKVALRLPDGVREALAACVTAKGDGTVRWEKFDADVLEQVLGLETAEEQLATANRLLELSGLSRIDNYSASLAGIVRTVRRYGHEHFLGRGSGGGADGNGEQQRQQPQQQRRKTKAEKEAEREAWSAILAEDGILDEEAATDDAEIDDRGETNKLVGTPHPDDVLLYALPVCAPYATLSKYRFRVKLTPGSLKRGKAGRQALEMFLRGEAPGRDADRDLIQGLIKAIPEAGWSQAMIGDVKISAPGASKMAKKHKAQKKKGGGGGRKNRN